MNVIKNMLAATAAFSLAALPVVANAQEAAHQTTTVLSSESQFGGDVEQTELIFAGLLSIGIIIGIILILDDDDDDEPVSP